MVRFASGSSRPEWRLSLHYCPWPCVLDGSAGRLRRAPIGVAERRSRKAGHVDDCAQRTDLKAWSSPEVQTYREEQARKARLKQDRGYDWPHQ